MSLDQHESADDAVLLTEEMCLAWREELRVLLEQRAALKAEEDLLTRRLEAAAVLIAVREEEEAQMRGVAFSSRVSPETRSMFGAAFAQMNDPV